MLNYDKTEIKEQLTKDNIYQLLYEWGGEPEYTNFGILSATICHNPKGVGSRKLYWYANSNLFRCYTGCDEPTFDIFDLTRKVFSIQFHKDLDLNDAVRYIASYFGFIGHIEIEENYGALTAEIEYEETKLKQLNKQAEKPQFIILKEYDTTILENLDYRLKLEPWLKEGINQNAINEARIGYYLGNDQITIPHFDMNGRFVGLRGRSMCQADCDLYGKYRPLIVNKQMYNHPLGLNLYNLNKVKDNIKALGTAIVFESEKACLLFKSYFGLDSDISVACCGSNLSQYQIELLIAAGAHNIILAFDRQFQEIGDKEHQHIKKNILKLAEKNHLNINFSAIFDKDMITAYKASPIDEGKDKFLKLYKERIIL